MRRRNATHTVDRRGPSSSALFWDALKWRKGTICAWAAIGLVLSAAALLFERPQFTATTELLLGVSAVGAVADRPALIENQIETIKSKRLAHDVVEKQRLWNNTEFACDSNQPLQQILGLVRTTCSGSQASPADRATILSNFQNATSVSRAGESFVVNVSFTSSDPQTSAAAANGLASAYVAYRSDVQKRDVELAGERFADHIAKLREISDTASAADSRLSTDTLGHAPSNEQARSLKSQSQAYRWISKSLLDRYAQSLREETSPVTEPRILSEAEPPANSTTPDVPLVLLLGSGLGLAFGVIAAMRDERTARPIRSLEQIERDIGVPALGVVPLVQGRRLLPASYQVSPLLLHDRGDALRGVKIAVQEHVARDTHVIGIVSPYEGEGKSTVAFNLAVLEVESGRRVLLVDANLHRPSLGLSLPRGTLLAQLERRSELTDLVTRSELGFDFIGECSTETPVHPAVLLGSPAMRQLIHSAREHYDCIVCDLPNVLGRADVRAAAELFDALVLVTEWGRTPAAAATRAVLKSSAIADRLAGVIINKAPSRRSAIS